MRLHVLAWFTLVPCERGSFIVYSLWNSTAKCGRTEMQLTQGKVIFVKCKIFALTESQVFLYTPHSWNQLISSER